MVTRSELTQPQAQDLANHFLGPGWRAILFADTCSLVGVEEGHFAAPNWRAAFRAAGVKLPLRPRFVAKKARVMDGEKCVAVAHSSNFAIRTANALNDYDPDRRGR